MYASSSRRASSSSARFRGRGAGRPRRPLAESLERRTLLSAGDPDPTFSGDGFLFGQDVIYSRGAAAVAVQADGKVVMVGHRGPANDYRVSRARDLLVSRFNADGSRDTGFGNGGSIIADLGGYDVGYAVQIDDAGRIVVGATAHSTAYAPQWVVLRYLPDGAPDPTFGDNGRIAVEAGYTGGPGIHDLDLGPGGQIVAAGRTADGATVMRFTDTGELDATFDGDGKVIIPRSAGAATSGEGVEVMADGRVVVAGWAQFPSAFVARLNENGSPDATFGDGGRVTVAIEPSDVAVDSAGRVVVAGRYGNHAALRRLTAAGQVDATFGGGDGLATFDAPGDGASGFQSVIVAPGDKPVAGGILFAEYPISENFLTARFNADGSPDTTFNGTGFAAEDFYVAEDRGDGVALAPGGKVVTAGFATANGFTSEAVVRYNADGSRDPSFDGDGKAVGRFEGVKREIRDVLVQPDRKVVVGGAQVVGPRVDFYLARYHPDGSPDNSFEGDGRATTYFGNNRRTIAQSLLLQPDGKIIAAGSVDGDVDLAVARYHPDGSLDFTFGGDGTVVTEVGAGNSSVFDAALYPGGRIVVSGSQGTVRYNTDGSLDRSFGGNGVVEGAGGHLLVQGERLLISRGVRVARYHADGSPDPTFASPELQPGIETCEEDDEEAYSTISDMAFAPDGDVIVLGDVHDHIDEREKYALWRLNPDGTPDTAFGTGGRVIYVPDDPYELEVGELAVGADGRIVVNGFGESWEYPYGGYVSVAVRHDPDGSLDTTFGIDGVARFGRHEGLIADDLALDPTGDIVVAGRGLGAPGGGTDGWGIARLDGAGTAGGITYDRAYRVVTVIGELGDDNIHINLTRGRLFVNVNGERDNFARTSVRSVRVFGRDGNDTVTVTTEVPDLQISGGAGDDTLRGGPGRERLMGNDGNDLLDGGMGADTIVGGAGTDSLDYRSRTNAVRVLRGGDSYGAGNGEADERDFLSHDIEKIYGGSGDDVLYVLSFTGGAAFGGGGNDTLRGLSGPDALWGDAGDDLLYNSYGADYLRGGSGNDTVFAPQSTDDTADLVVTLDGKPNDGRAGEGDNVFTDVENVVGGDGNDHFTGSSANNRLEGGNGNDTLLGGAGNDTLLGGTGADTLTDTQGTNTLDGQFGADTINGVTEPSDAVTLQAENLTRSGGARVASARTGYTGTGYVEFTGAGYIEFTFNAPSAGRYRLTVRYANGTDSFGSMPVAVNDTRAWTWFYGPTGSWSAWDTRWVDVDLAAGPNRIRLSAHDADAAHIDSVVIE